MDFHDTLSKAVGVEESIKPLLEGLSVINAEGDLSYAEIDSLFNIYNSAQTLTSSHAYPQISSRNMSRYRVLLAQVKPMPVVLDEDFI